VDALIMVSENMIVELYHRCGRLNIMLAICQTSMNEPVIFSSRKWHFS